MGKVFGIGTFRFRIRLPDEMEIPLNFMKFEVKNEQPHFNYEIQVADELPQPAGELIVRRTDLSVYQIPQGECRMIGLEARPYAWYCDLSETEAKIVVRQDQVLLMKLDTVFSSLLALERQMIHHDALILHCAYIRYQGEAILFSAPSGTGKTTQASLWEHYKKSETINGDKALLWKHEAGWVADGWPVCGTSNVCRKEMTPIRVIVMLKQGAENKIRKLTGIEAFSKLYAQVTMNKWNREAVSQNMTLLEELIQNVPIYELQCTISENAVKCLENMLLYHRL